jgi:hypothetical protein
MLSLLRKTKANKIFLFSFTSDGHFILQPSSSIKENVSHCSNSFIMQEILQHFSQGSKTNFDIKLGCQYLKYQLIFTSYKMQQRNCPDFYFTFNESLLKMDDETE